ncbi:MAG: AMP-binding protein [Actinobacteria bacterium]|nr:AMP-binding protein [Actinomycetota bacterium]
MTAGLADRFESVVDDHGDLPAVDAPDGVVAYIDLEARANRVATWLVSIGLSDGDRVGIALWNRIEHLEVLLGAFKARLVPVNVNCRYTATEARDLLIDADARVVIHEPAATATIQEATDGLGTTCVPIGPVYESALAAASPDRPSITRSGDDHYLLYTGGSTGTPKGVLWRQSDLFTAAMAGAEQRRPGGRMLPASPLTHGTAQWSALSALLSAGTVVLGPLHGVDAAALWSRVADARVNRLVIVGDAFARPLLDALDAEPDRWDLSSLVAITSGGARWSAASRDGLLRHLPHVAMINSFGASETGGQGSQVTFAGAEPSPTRGLLRFAADDTEVVLDEHLAPIRPGSNRIGTLARRGAVPLGYFGDAERSARVFPMIDGVRHALPGDLATVDADGTIVVLGRDRNVINTGGEKVFAEEVEARLMTHPSVTLAVVVGIADETWGETIGALVTLAADTEIVTDDLVAHCATTLARFKIPRTIHVVDTIRYLPSGKLDRRWAADSMARFTAPTNVDPRR